MSGPSDLEWVHERSADESLAVATVPDPSEVVARLADQPGIEAVEEPVRVEALGFPDDPLFDQQWNLRAIGVARGWRAGGGGGVTVAVIDTGVTRVADLEETRILDGFSFVEGEPTAEDGNGHGTHVAGTIAQSTHNGLGVAIAPQARILPIKALSRHGFGMSLGSRRPSTRRSTRARRSSTSPSAAPAPTSSPWPRRRRSRRASWSSRRPATPARRACRTPARCPGSSGSARWDRRTSSRPTRPGGPGSPSPRPGATSAHPAAASSRTPSMRGATPSRSSRGRPWPPPRRRRGGGAPVGFGGDRALTQRLLRTGGGPGVPTDPRYGHGRLDLAAAVGPSRCSGTDFSSPWARWPPRSSPGSERAAAWPSPRGRRNERPRGGWRLRPLLPLPPSALTGLLARPLLPWPAAMLPDPYWRNPLPSRQPPLPAHLLPRPHAHPRPHRGRRPAGIATHRLRRRHRRPRRLAAARPARVRVAGLHAGLSALCASGRTSRGSATRRARHDHGSLEFIDLGPGAWQLTTPDGGRVRLVDDPEVLDGREVVIEGKRLDGAGVAMVGPIVEVHRIEAR